MEYDTNLKVKHITRNTFSMYFWPEAEESEIS